MKRDKFIERVNSKGDSLGYPLFVTPDGRIFQTPPQSIPFKLVIWDKLSATSSLANQAIMKYDTWLKGCNVGNTEKPDVPENIPVHPMTASLPDFPPVPAYLQPEIVDMPLIGSRFYIFAKPELRPFFRYQKAIYLTKAGLEIWVPKGLQVAEAHVTTLDGLDEVYYYIQKN